MKRYDIINRFIKERNYKNYLEIGVHLGYCWENIDCEFMTGVDPNPILERPAQPLYYDSNTSQFVYGKKRIIKRIDDIKLVTSDDWFNEISNKKISYDIIFIDGLHESKQVDKDIQNSIKYLSEEGVIVIHDCSPIKYENTLSDSDEKYWNGDVWKSFVKKRFDNLGDDRYFSYTIDTDHGCGILDFCKKTKNNYTRSIYRQLNISQKSIIEENYNSEQDRFENFSNNRVDLLNLIDVSSFLNINLD